LLLAGKVCFAVAGKVCFAVADKGLFAFSGYKGCFALAVRVLCFSG